MYVCMYVCIMFFLKLLVAEAFLAGSLGLRPVGARFDTSLAQLVMSLGFVSSARVKRPSRRSRLA